MDTANKESTTVEGLKTLDSLFCVSFTVKKLDSEEKCPDCGEVHETGTEKNTVEVSAVIDCKPIDAAKALSELMLKDSRVSFILRTAVEFYKHNNSNPEQQLRDLLSKILGS